MSEPSIAFVFFRKLHVWGQRTTAIKYSTRMLFLLVLIRLAGSAKCSLMSLRISVSIIVCDNISPRWNFSIIFFEIAMRGKIGNYRGICTHLRVFWRYTYGIDEEGVCRSFVKKEERLGASVMSLKSIREVMMSQKHFRIFQFTWFLNDFQLNLNACLCIVDSVHYRFEKSYLLQAESYQWLTLESI